MPPTNPPQRFTATQALVRGGVGFGLASLCVFATVGFAEGWVYQTFSPAGAYAAWTLLFIALGGAALRPLYAGSPGRFFGIFALAFLLYAVAWIAAYFTLGMGIGEWVGALLGSVALAVTLAVAGGVPRRIPFIALILFIANALGYFLGSAVNAAVGDKAGMLLWGAIYGVFLGAGLGLSLWRIQDATGETASPR